ncbi:uncharacterized protein [Dermacentor albipictus]|uniref:uncharacterized protein isoform X3 n=1 Tax=Dermacentor albipictus TaxID=60249 RepID=UPI0038FBFECE
MCMCETLFEIALLGLICLLLNVYYLIIPIMTTGVEGVEAIINAIESVVFALCALLLLLATMTASKKLLDAFIVCTKARILYYCLRGVYCLIKVLLTGDDSPKRGREAGMFALEFLPTRLGERLAAVKFEQKKAGFSAFSSSTDFKSSPTGCGQHCSRRCGERMGLQERLWPVAHE